MGVSLGTEERLALCPSLGVAPALAHGGGLGARDALVFDMAVYLGGGGQLKTEASSTVALDAAKGRGNASAIGVGWFWDKDRGVSNVGAWARSKGDGFTILLHPEGATPLSSRASTGATGELGVVVVVLGGPGGLPAEEEGSLSQAIQSS